MSVIPGSCFICRCALVDESVVVVKKRGIQSLVAISVKRGLQENAKFVEKLHEVIVHDACRKRYTAPHNIEASVRRGGDTTHINQLASTSRSSSGSMNLQSICFLCGEEITQKFLQLQKRLPTSRRNNVHTVESFHIRGTIIENARRRGDDWGKEIIHRLSCTTDLVAADARYHQLCYKKFYSFPGPVREKVFQEAKNINRCMQFIFSHVLENRDECQFSLNHLIDQINGDYKPDIRTVKTHLMNHFGDKIIFSEIGSGRTQQIVMCFTDVSNKILYDNWYNERKHNPQEERLRVVKSAAEIVLQDIRCQVYDTTTYPPSDDFLKDSESVVPESLQLFLETILLKHKRHYLEGWKKKCLSIAHAIISAARSHSFLSTIKIGLSTYLYRKFGSKNLVNLCAAMGFSSSYNEAMLLESSSIVQSSGTPHIKKNAFVQFVYDNADVNVNTLDGENTFHEMGGIMVVTPRSAVLPDTPIPRLKKNISAEEISSYMVSEIHRCNMTKSTGLSTIKIVNVDAGFKMDADILPAAPELLWLLGKSCESAGIPGWNGYMEEVTEGQVFSCSKILFLPFIHAPPTDYDTVLTSLRDAAARSKAHGQKTCFVTCDQPLYMKARDIIQNCPGAELTCVEVRLGGFHLLMSYMGAIGNIMGGSGLKQLLATIYAENSVDNLMKGHAYSRAVRAHTLTNLALAHLIFNEIDITHDEKAETEKLLLGTQRSRILFAEENEHIQSLTAKFKSALEKLEEGPTAKLWVLYYRMTLLMKKFIQAERMGDWNLHLQIVSQMLPFFHSSGHFFYAKSARLYLQDMSTLQDRMDRTEYQLFTKGCFTIRRSNKFWSGLWTDLTIEQVLMCSMKSQGGLTHGRGISTSVLSRWAGGMVSMLNICEQVQGYWDIDSPTSSQHVDMRPMQIVRDTSDVKKLIAWFNSHPPFLSRDKLISISSGTVGGTHVNCYNAREEGLKGVNQIIGKTFGNVTFSRKDKVLSLAMPTSIKINKKRVDVEPLTIFQRMCIMKQSDLQLKTQFMYELAPYPMALFSDNRMRKGTKSAFYAAFTQATENSISVQAKSFAVVDGGFLLHKVVWHRNDSVRVITASYINYIFKHFGRNVCVVFDGYPENAAQKSTKFAERSRRYSAASVEILFDASTIITVPQEKMLSNCNNKVRLIEHLCSAFALVGIETKISKEDADRDIVITAMQKSTSNDDIIIFGEDVDLLVLLCGLGYNKTNVYFQKCTRGAAGCILFSTSSFNKGEVNLPPGFELFIHAFTGCDTTSALAWQGKMKMWGHFRQNQALVDQARIFLQKDATHKQITTAGDKCLVSLYGGDVTRDTLNDVRFRTFVKTAANAKANLSRLPPTTEAASYHHYRTYHQVQKWLGVEIEATDWGWESTSAGLIPITSRQAPAPAELLKRISCKCKKGCRGGCTCVKAGLRCSVMCATCSGEVCQNPALIIIEEDDDDEPQDNHDDTQKRESLPIWDEDNDSPIVEDILPIEESKKSERPGPSNKRRRFRTCV